MKSNTTGSNSNTVPTTRVDVTAYANGLINLINKVRIKKGLSALKLDSSLSKAAFLRAEELSKSLPHTKPDGANFTLAIKDCSYTSIGEMVFYGQKDPAEVMNSCKNSSEHKANILSENFNDIGVGVYQSNRTIYWVQIFGSKSTTSTSSSTTTSTTTSLTTQNDAKAYANGVINLVNKVRAKKGLCTLKLDSSLSKAAFDRAREIVKLFSHTRPDGTSFDTIINGYGSSFVGENIASGQKDPTEVMTGWLNSLGHKANILKTDYKDIGVGVYLYEGIIYWVQIFGSKSY